MAIILRVLVIFLIAGIWIETVHAQAPDDATEAPPASETKEEEPKPAEKKPEEKEKKPEEKEKKPEDKEKKPETKSADTPKETEEKKAPGQAKGVAKKIADSIDSIYTLVEDITKDLKSSKSKPEKVQNVLDAIVKRLKDLSDDWLGPAAAKPKQLLDSVQTIGDKITSIIKKYTKG